MDDLIREQLAAGITDLDKVADIALSKLLADFPEDAHAAFYPATRQRTSTLSRTINHQAELDAEAGVKTKPAATKSAYVSPAMAYRPLEGFDLDALVQIPNGGGTYIQVPWGDVTVAQHRLRIDMLKAQMEGTRATIARHEQAVSVCEQAGVSTLRELEAKPQRSKASVAIA